MIQNFLQSSQVGNINTNKAAEARKMISERWEGLGFTKGLKGYLKENMAILFENQANTMLNESTDAQNSGSFETVVFPLVRRVFSRLLANDIVSVQAMNMPIGKLFFILPVTSEILKIQRVLPVHTMVLWAMREPSVVMVQLATATTSPMRL